MTLFPFKGEGFVITSIPMLSVVVFGWSSRSMVRVLNLVDENRNYNGDYTPVRLTANTGVLRIRIRVQGFLQGFL